MGDPRDAAKPKLRYMFGVAIGVHDSVALTRTMEIHVQTISKSCKVLVCGGCVVGE